MSVAKNAVIEDENAHPIEALIEVMRRLREPEVGCPWDLEQDFRSIAPYTIEEAYEVMDAIERKDMSDLQEELGDLLLQPIYHAQMAKEEGLFDIDDVIKGITEKMVARHPHVFGDVKAHSASDVDAIWDARKKAEKAQAGKVKPEDVSAIDGVTLALPALLRAQKLQKKAAKVGFEWTDIEDIFAKLEEEIQELRHAITTKDQDNAHEEIGDILFVVANLARKCGVNAEDSLRECNVKFERRFRGLEADLKVDGVAVDDASLEQMTRYWDLQKAKERNN